MVELSNKVKLDPWGHISVKDYGWLMRTFGIKPFNEILDKFREIAKPNRYMRRGIIFGHRDFDKRVINPLTKGEPVALLTGFMPSGKFHFGHKLTADQIIYYQRLGVKIHVVIADAEAYAVRKMDREKTIEIGLYEYIANLIALGLDPSRAVFYFQTNQKPAYYRLIQMFSRKVSLAEMEAIYGNMEPSKVISALTQAADILHVQLDDYGGYKNVIVPVGADQDPHLRLARDIADRFHNELGLERPASTYHMLQRGLDGNKMSSSKPESTIFLTDSLEVARSKLMRALTGGRATVEEQKKLGAEPWKCTVYDFYMFQLIDDDKGLQEIYDSCVSGKLLCGHCKRNAWDLLEKFLEEHQKKLEKAKDVVLKYVDPPKF
ncbi:MAG: tryptophan--tRNA ligase [Desulfurococcales archaeon]|nr:tryptophan--tRNA ligase [Desulfurococcales archaeon]